MSLYRNIRVENGGEKPVMQSQTVEEDDQNVILFSELILFDQILVA